MYKVPLEGLHDALPAPIRMFVCRASFESRSLSVAKAIGNLDSAQRIVFVGKRRGRLAEKHSKELSSVLGQSSFTTFDVAEPVSIANQLLELSRAICTGAGKTVIDITTFRREELLILLRMLAYFYTNTVDCDLVYVEAAQMARQWLSRDTTGFRSIIGYSGEMIPSRRAHLIVMLGFELQRARDVIDNYEPRQLTVGYGRRGSSISDEFQHRNHAFFKTLKSWYGDQLTEFDFSLVDPLETRKDLRRMLAQDLKHNVVIAPMNNKLSTIGAGLVGIENERVQLCYSLVSQYNEEEYSTPGANAYVMALRDLLA